MKSIFTSLLLLTILFGHSQINYSCPLNLQQSLQNGTATVTSTPFDIGNISSVFDGDDVTLGRSANVNPMIITLSFNNIVNLTSVRVIQSYGDGWFTVEAANTLSDLTNQTGSYQLLLNQIPTVNGVPVGGAIVKAVSTSRKIFRLTVRKTSGDNYVHVNDWTLTGDISYQADALSSTPSSINMHPGWEVWLNKPGSSQCPVISSVLGGISSPVNTQCIAWSVSDPTVLELNTTTQKLKAIKAGMANLTATIGGAMVNIPVTVTRLQSSGDPDLSVRYIKRLPEINYVENSSNPTVEGWPAVGQTVIWRAHIRNWSANTYNNVSYQWKKNGVVIASGTMNFQPDEEKTSQINDTWAFQRDSLEFVIDNTNSIAEFSELNNSIKIYTNSITLNLYVEQSVYDYFHVYQNELGIGTNSWDDWAQISHVKRWNQMFHDAVWPDVPNGVLDRIRIDSIVIVPDNTLPAGNNPNPNDRTVDLLWPFGVGLLNSTFYSDHTSKIDDNPFYFEGSLLHELGHARYLIDDYGMDIDTSFVQIKEGNELIYKTPLMPIVAWNICYYNQQNPTLMSGYYTVIGRYDAMALNKIAYRRAVCGNTNAPCNIGVFINDLPTNNFITLKDQNNIILSNACVKIYRGVANNSSWYGKVFDNIPDLSFTADANGTVNVGRNPFSSSNIVHTYGNSTMDIIIRVEKNGRIGYKVIEASSFNMEYWKGNILNANYTYQVNMLNCSDFAGSSCNCALITPPTITASGGTTFCQGGNVILTSNMSGGNQWYKDGIAISGATSSTYMATISGTYTSKVTVNGEQSLASNTIVVTVNQPPTPIITAGSATTFCTGGSVTLASNVANGNQWYKDGMIINGSTGNTLNVTASGSYTTKVTLNGCESSTSNALIVTVSSVPATPAITSGSAITFCNGGNVTLTSNAASGNQWYKDGTAINGSTNNTLNVTVSGSYATKVTLNGCESSASNAIVVTVNPIPPAPVIGQNGNQLVSLSPLGNQWYLNSVAIAGATGQNYTPATSGNYTSQVTINGCSSAFSNTFNFIITAIQNIDIFSDQIKVLPNPVNDKLIIINSSNTLSMLNIRLFDIYGRQLINLKSGASRTEINMTKYTTGSYIIWIEDKKNKILGKKVIVKATE